MVEELYKTKPKTNEEIDRKEVEAAMKLNPAELEAINSVPGPHKQKRMVTEDLESEIVVEDAFEEPDYEGFLESVPFPSAKLIGDSLSNNNQNKSGHTPDGKHVGSKETVQEIESVVSRNSLHDKGAVEHMEKMRLINDALDECLQPDPIIELDVEKPFDKLEAEVKKFVESKPKVKVQSNSEIDTPKTQTDKKNEPEDRKPTSTITALEHKPELIELTPDTMQVQTKPEPNKFALAEPKKVKQQAEQKKFEENVEDLGSKQRYEEKINQNNNEEKEQVEPMTTAQKYLERMKRLNDAFDECGSELQHKKPGTNGEIEKPKTKPEIKKAEPKPKVNKSEPNKSESKPQVKKSKQKSKVNEKPKPSIDAPEIKKLPVTEIFSSDTDFDRENFLEKVASHSSSYHDHYAGFEEA